MADTHTDDRQLKATLRLIELTKLGLDEQEKLRPNEAWQRKLLESQQDSARWLQRIFWLLLIIGIALPIVPLCSLIEIPKGSGNF